MSLPRHWYWWQRIGLLKQKRRLEHRAMLKTVTARLEGYDGPLCERCGSKRVYVLTDLDDKCYDCGFVHDAQFQSMDNYTFDVRASGG